MSCFIMQNLDPRVNYSQCSEALADLDASVFLAKSSLATGESHPDLFSNYLFSITRLFSYVDKVEIQRWLPFF